MCVGGGDFFLFLLGEIKGQSLIYAPSHVMNFRPWLVKTTVKKKRGKRREKSSFHLFPYETEDLYGSWGEEGMIVEGSVCQTGLTYMETILRESLLVRLISRINLAS